MVAKDKELHIYATKSDDGTYRIALVGRGFDARGLGKVFDALGELTDNEDDDVLITFPVIPELEDPALMERLTREMESVEHGEASCISSSELRARLEEEFGSKLR